MDNHKNLLADSYLSPQTMLTSINPVTFDATEQIVNHACEIIKLQDSAIEKNRKMPSSKINIFLGHMTNIFRSAFYEKWIPDLITNFEMMNLKIDQPRIFGLIRHAMECACATPMINADFVRGPGWMKKFKKAHHGRFNSSLPLFAKISLVCVAFHPAENCKGVGSDFFENTNLNNSFVEKQGLVDFTSYYSNPLALNTNCFSFSYTLPYFFTANDLELTSLQSLHDIPKEALELLDMGMSLENLHHGIINSMKKGSGANPLSSVVLSGLTQMRYLMNISYSQDPGFAITTLSSNNSKEKDINCIFFTEILYQSLDRELTDKIEFAVCEYETLFTALYEGARRQRFHNFIDHINQLIVHYKISDPYLYFEPKTGNVPGLPPESVVPVEISNSWLHPFGAVLWPLHTFDSIESQAEQLTTLMQKIGLRAKADIFTVSEPGRA